MLPQDLGIGASFPEVSRTCGTLWWCERRFWLLTQHARSRVPSATHKMTATKVLDVLAKLPGRAGQARRPCIRSRPRQNKKRSKLLLKLLESECPDIWLLPPQYKWPVGWQNIEEPVVSWACLCVHRQQGLFFLSVNVDAIKKRQGRNRNLEPTVENVDEQSRAGETELRLLIECACTSGCTQRDCKPNPNLVDERRKMFESCSSAGVPEKKTTWFLGSEKVVQTPFPGPTKWKDTQKKKKTLQGTANWQARTSSSCLESSHRESIIINSSERNWKRKGEQSDVFSPIVLQCLCLAPHR